MICLKNKRLWMNRDLLLNQAISPKRQPLFLFYQKTYINPKPACHHDPRVAINERQRLAKERRLAIELQKKIELQSKLNSYSEEQLLKQNQTNQTLSNLDSQKQVVQLKMELTKKKKENDATTEKLKLELQQTKM